MIHTELPIIFSESNDFFNQSEVFKSLQSFLLESFQDLKNIEKIYLSLTIKAILENIIKHDLTLESAINIEHKWLITENNSAMVKDFFYKTYFCEDSVYNQYTVEINNARDIIGMITFSVNNWILEINPNSIELLKKEAENFFKIKELKPTMKMK
jgi:hypothetical protein